MSIPGSDGHNPILVGLAQEVVLGIGREWPTDPGMFSPLDGIMNQPVANYFTVYLKDVNPHFSVELWWEPNGVITAIVDIPNRIDGSSRSFELADPEFLDKLIAFFRDQLAPW